MPYVDPTSPAAVESKRRAQERYKATEKYRQNLHRNNHSVSGRAARKTYKKSAAYREYLKRPDVKLGTRLRNRLNIAIKKGTVKGSAVRDLGCSIAELKLHLEKMFQPGMTWANWGRGLDKWHIDHIRPLASFNLDDLLQFKVAVHFSNLQPLWEAQNLVKGSKAWQRIRNTVLGT